MKTRLTLFLGLLGGFAILAPAQEQPPPPPDPAIAVSSLALNADQLDQLLGPIALYPDALIALILPAATEPADIVLAARYLADGGDPAGVSSRSWDESVKSLAHYPTVVKWMDENLAWTKQLGEAFRDQPAEVMKSVQRLRAKARAAGTLADSSPQQQVVVDGGVISIIPTQPDVIYVPYYDPVAVYLPPSPNFYPESYFSYSPAFAAGAWLTFECDWHHRTIWTVNRRWNERHDWRHPIFPGQPGYVNDPNRRPWRPTQTFTRPSFANVDHSREVVAHPTPINSFNNPPVTRNAAPENRDDHRGREFNANRTPVVVNPTFASQPVPNSAAATNPAVTPAPAVTPQPHRSTNAPSRDRFDNREQPSRVAIAQNPPAVASAPAPAANPEIRFPGAYAPTRPNVTAMPAPAYAPPAPIVAPISRPLVAPMGPAPIVAAPPPGQQMRMPAAAPPPAPAPAPAPASQPAAPGDDRRHDGERRNQPN